MRVKGWERALNAVERKHATQPFAWGVSDCFLLPLDGIVAVSGADPWPGLHDYDSAHAAARRLAEQGYRSLGDAFADKLAEIAPAFAQRGDVGLVQEGDFMVGALFVTRGVACKTEAGLRLVERARVVKAFRVA